MGKNKENSQKTKEAALELEGVVVESVKGAFHVKMSDPSDDGHIVRCHLSGKMRQNSIKIVVGDRVRIEVSPYDLSHGRITYRMK